ncbi:hypothetical protein [Lactococcus cremoris]|nr:hypothetical protein [Lactococcus cremoris]
MDNLSRTRQKRLEAKIWGVSMTTQKEKNVLDFKDKDILKNHKVADKDDEWFHEQWKNKLSGLKEAGDGKVRKNL